jgi:general secretion pathway protein I
LKLRCEQTLSADGPLFQVDVQVLDASRDAPPLARLSTQVRAE